MVTSILTGASSVPSFQGGGPSKPLESLTLNEVMQRISRLAAEHECLVEAQMNLEERYIPISLEAKQIINQYVPDIQVSSSSFLTQALQTIDRERSKLDMIRYRQSLLAQPALPKGILENIFFNLDVLDPDLCPRILPQRSESKSYGLFQEEQELALHSVYFLHTEVEKRNEAKKYQAILYELERVIALIDNPGLFENISDLHSIQQQAKDRIIQCLKRLTRGDLQDVSESFRYEQKPWSFIPLLDVASAYHTLEFAYLRYLPSDEEPQIIARYSLEQACALVSRPKYSEDRPEMERAIFDELICTKPREALLLLRDHYRYPYMHQERAFDDLDSAFHSLQWLAPEEKVEELEEELLRIQRKNDSSVIAEVDCLEQIVVLHIGLGNTLQAVRSIENVRPAIDGVLCSREGYAMLIAQLFAEGRVDQGVLLLQRAFDAKSDLARSFRRVGAKNIVEMFLHLRDFRFMPQLEKMDINFLPTLVNFLLQTGHIFQARCIAKRIVPTESRDEALYSVSLVYLSRNCLEEAFQVSKEITSQMTKDALLNRLAKIYLLKAQTDPQEETKSIERACELCQMVDPHSQWELQEKIWAFYFSKGQFTQALDIAKCISESITQTDVLSQTFEKFFFLEKYEKAQEVASPVRREPARSTMLGKLLIKQRSNPQKVAELFGLIDMEKLPEDGMKAELRSIKGGH